MPWFKSFLRSSGVILSEYQPSILDWDVICSGTREPSSVRMVCEYFFGKGGETDEGEGSGGSGVDKVPYGGMYVGSPRGVSCRAVGVWATGLASSKYVVVVYTRGCQSGARDFSSRSGFKLFRGFVVWEGSLMMMTLLRKLGRKSVKHKETISRSVVVESKIPRLS